MRGDRPAGRRQRRRVQSLDDLRAIATLVPLGVEGAIVGKALYAGAFTLEDALAEVSA